MFAVAILVQTDHTKLVNGMTGQCIDGAGGSSDRIYQTHGILGHAAGAVQSDSIHRQLEKSNIWHSLARSVRWFFLGSYGFSSEELLNEIRQQSNLVRDIFGNPFRPAAIDPAWLTWNNGTVVKLAQAIYDERRFTDMPILADALTGAGCRTEEILSHCREPRAHVRGCWVADLLLRKE